MWKLGIFDGCARKRERFLSMFANIKVCCDIESGIRERMFAGNQYDLAKKIGTYQATISNMKAGTERNMWPTVEQVIKLSQIQGQRRIDRRLI